MEQVRAVILHEEREIFWVALIAFFAVIILQIIILLALRGSSEEDGEVALIMIGIMGILLVLALAFSRYTLRITSDYLVAGFPAYSVKLSWENVVNVDDYEKKTLQFGGYGIRFTKVDGKKAMVVNIPGTDYVILTLRNYRWDYLILSTKKPEDVKSYIRQEIELHKK